MRVRGQTANLDQILCEHAAATVSPILHDDRFVELTVGIHCVREKTEFGQEARMCKMNGTAWLLATSMFMLVAVVAFAIMTGFVPYGSPAEVIQTFYSACNSRNYSVAERMLVPDVNWVLTHHVGAVDGGLPGICDIETKQGHLQRVEILDEEVHGEIGKVRYKLYYGDGTTLEETQGLVVKHWGWKITP